MLKFFLAVVMVIGVAGQVQAENTIFGLTMGMTQKQAESQMTSESEFTCLSVEHCHASFLPYGFDEADLYVFYFGKNGEGLYTIAVVFESKDDNYGFDVKKVYREIKSDIQPVYGIPDEVDDIVATSIWDEPQDWIQSLKVGHRQLMSIWESSSSKTLEDRKLSRVVLRASFFNRLPSVNLGFVFENKEAVENAKRKARKF